MSLESYKNDFKLKKFYKDAFVHFKNKINCFALFSDRIIEGNIYQFKNSSVVDFGFKYLIKTENLLADNSINLKVIRLESTLNDVHYDYNKFKLFILKK